MNDLQLLSIDEAAKTLSVSPWTVRAHVRQGTISVVRCGRRVLIPRAELVRVAQKGLPPLQGIHLQRKRQRANDPQDRNSFQAQ